MSALKNSSSLTAQVASKPAAPVKAKAVTSKPLAKKPVAAAKQPAVKPAATKPVQTSKPAHVAKPAPAAKPALTAKPAPATKATPADKTTAAGSAVKVEKVKKPKLIRDSFTIPKAEYVVIEALKERAGKLSRAAKKSELLRAGIKALAAMSDAAFLSALTAVPTIKTGRPSAEN